MATNWTISPALKALRDQVDRKAPKRRKEHDGSIGDSAHRGRKSDHNPDRHGVVNAIDITHDPAGGFCCETFFQQLVIRKDKRVKYAIFNGRIVNSQVEPWKVRKYGGSNKHEKHIHISCVDGCTIDSDWPLGKQPGDETLLGAGSDGPYTLRDANMFAFSSLVQLAPTLIEALRLADTVTKKVRSGQVTADILRQNAGPALTILQAVGATVFPDLDVDKQIAAGALRTRGDYIREVQQMLIERGADLKADGEYGPITRTAIETFQRGSGLVVDGYAGPKTFAALSARAS